jgi:hypothetical protein
MAKKIETKEQTEVMSTSEFVAGEVELTHSAISMVKIQPGNYNVVKIRFNPLGNRVGGIEIIKEGANRAEAEEILKLTVAREVFLKV